MDKSISKPKYRVGYIDEESTWVDTFTRRLKGDFEIVPFPISSSTSLDSILIEIENNALDCLIVDFELKEAALIQFNGDEIIDHLRKKYPFFPVFIITGKDEEDVLGQVEDNDIVRSKDELDPENLSKLILRINNKISSYRKKISDAEEEVKRLVQKKNSSGLTGEDEEVLTDKYLFLEKINPNERTIPPNWIQPERISMLNEFVNETKKVLEELRKLNK